MYRWPVQSLMRQEPELKDEYFPDYKTEYSILFILFLYFNRCLKNLNSSNSVEITRFDFEDNYYKIAI